MKLQIKIDSIIPLSEYEIKYFLTRESVDYLKKREGALLYEEKFPKEILQIFKQLKKKTGQDYGLKEGSLIKMSILEVAYSYLKPPSKGELEEKIKTQMEGLKK